MFDEKYFFSIKDNTGDVCDGFSNSYYPALQ